MQAYDEYSQFAAVREVCLEGHVVHVFGDIDVVTAPHFEASIVEAIDAEETRGGTVTVNFTKCRYLDSSGLAVLVRVRRRLGSRLHLLVKPRTMISRLMQITGFDRIFNIATELRPAPDAMPVAEIAG